MNIQVFVRIRPLNKKELAENQTIGWEYNDNAMLEETPNGQRSYNYDRCFGEKDNNTFVYGVVCRRLVMKAMEGFNGTVFAYGQTGSGKTWTMRGSEADPGIIKLCIDDVLGYVEKNRKDKKVIIKVSYMEIYNEEINDLLQPGFRGRNLKIVTDDPVKGAIIGTLVEEPVDSHEAMMAVLLRGEENRSYASTEMNVVSSRSHVIYRLLIEVTNLEDDGQLSSNTRISYLNLVDLAGSERQKSTGASGSTLKEGANINKSLLSLGAVINKLGESMKPLKKGQKPVFIPYRDSKLTRILKQSLGGNTLTSMLCAVSPAPMYREETVSTLKFGQLCKMIKNSVKSNEIIDEKAQLKLLKAEVAKLKEQLASGGGSLAAANIDDNLTDDTQVTIGMLRTVKAEKLELEEKINTMNDLLEGKTVESLLKEINENTQMQKHWFNWRKENEPKVLALDQLRGELDLAVENNQSLRDELVEQEEKIERERKKLYERKSELEEETRRLEEKQLKSENILRLLDEKESELKWRLAETDRQRHEFENTVHALERREILIEDWSRNHRTEKEKLEEHEEVVEKKIESLKELERRHQDNLLAIKAEEDKLNLRRLELDHEKKDLQRKKKEHVALDATLEARESQCKNRETENELKERQLRIREQGLDKLEELLREKESTNREETKRNNERDEALRKLEDKMTEREAKTEFDMQQVLDIKDSNEEIYRQSLEMSKVLNEKEERLAKLEADIELKQEEIKRGLATQKYNEEVMASREKRMEDLESRESEFERKEKIHQEEAAKWYEEITAVSAMHSKEKKRLQTDLQQQIANVDNFRLENERLKGEIDKKQDEVNALKGKTTEQLSQLNGMNVLLQRAQTQAKEASDAEMTLKGQLKLLQRQRDQEANMVAETAAQLVDAESKNSPRLTPVSAEDPLEDDKAREGKKSLLNTLFPGGPVEDDKSLREKDKRDSHDDSVDDFDASNDDEVTDNSKMETQGIKRVERLDLDSITSDDLITKEQVIEQIEYTVLLLERVLSRYPAVAPLLQSMDRRHEKEEQQRQHHDELMMQAEKKIRDLQERLDEELARKREEHARNALLYAERQRRRPIREGSSTERILKRHSAPGAQDLKQDWRRASYALGDKDVNSILAFKERVPSEVLKEIEDDRKKRNSVGGGALDDDIPGVDNLDDMSEEWEYEDMYGDLFPSNDGEEENDGKDGKDNDEGRDRSPQDTAREGSEELSQRLHDDSVWREQVQDLKRAAAKEDAEDVDVSTIKRESILKHGSNMGNKRSSRRVSINVEDIGAQLKNDAAHLLSSQELPPQQLLEPQAQQRLIQQQASQKQTEQQAMQQQTEQPAVQGQTWSRQQSQTPQERPSTIQKQPQALQKQMEQQASQKQTEQQAMQQQMEQPAVQGQTWSRQQSQPLQERPSTIQKQPQALQTVLDDDNRRVEGEKVDSPKGPETSPNGIHKFQPASFTPLEFSALGSPALPTHYGSVLDGFHGRGMIPPATARQPDVASMARQEQVHHLVHKQQMLSQRRMSQQQMLLDRQRQRELRRSYADVSGPTSSYPSSASQPSTGSAMGIAPQHPVHQPQKSSPPSTSSYGASNVREKQGVQIPVKTIALTQTLGNKQQHYAHSPQGHVGNKILGIGER